LAFLQGFRNLERAESLDLIQPRTLPDRIRAAQNAVLATGIGANSPLLVASI
jgi:hypothetical protein